MKTTNDLLEGILAALTRQNHALGFGHPPKPRYVYANRQYKDCLWYFWDGAKNEHEPIEATALTGIIEKIELETKEFRGKAEAKINLTIRADRPYIIQSGYDTLFAKGLLYTLSRMPKSAFAQPITIAVEPGETEQVLFCRIYTADGQSVYDPYPDEVDWGAVLEKAIAKINNRSTAPASPTDPIPDPAAKVISLEQAKRLFTISQKAGLKTDALKILIADFQYISTKDIQVADYERICTAATDANLVAAYNAKLDPPTEPALPLGTWP